MKPGVKIRGIYSTALTKFFLDQGCVIASPSEAIAERFEDLQDHPVSGPMVEIHDLPDRQGILLRGERAYAGAAAEMIRKELPDAVVRKQLPSLGADIQVDFPFLSKEKLDFLRNRIVPTLFNHHRLRIIDSERVDVVEERDLFPHPEKREELSRRMGETLIYGTYRTGKVLALEHVKVDGRVVLLSEGEILEWEPTAARLLLKRFRPGGRGRYDGLGLPKAEGDYAITSVKEGSWFFMHTYYRRDGERIGDYFNINTPVEFYPHGIRYVDLEVDVVRHADGEAQVVDQEDLARICLEGLISPRLKKAAMDTVSEIRRRLASGGRASRQPLG